MHQPVYVGDLVQALFNGMEANQNCVINAVGPEQMTQESMVKFFLDLAGKPFKPVKIPYEICEVMAKHFPKGRLAPYAVSLLKHMERNTPEPLSKDPFETIVGKQLTTISHIYERSENKNFKFPKSPIFEHMQEILRAILIIPEARRDFFKMSTKFGASIVLNAIKIYFSQDNKTP